MNETQRRKPEKWNPALSDLETTRKDLSAMTIAFINGEISEATLRAATYAINSLTKLMHASKILDVEKRLAALEKGQR